MKLLRLALLVVCGVLVAGTTWEEALQFNTELADKLPPLPRSEPLSKDEIRDRYLDLVADSVLGLSFPNSEYSLIPNDEDGSLKAVKLDRDLRDKGKDLPFIGISTTGKQTLQRIRKYIETELIGQERNDRTKGGPNGAIVTCAPYRGGTGVYMRAVLNAHNDFEQTVLVAGNKFEGPVADAKLLKSKRGAPDQPHDKSEIEYLQHWSRSQKEIEDNFMNHLSMGNDEAAIAIVNLQTCLKDKSDAESYWCEKLRRREAFKVGLLHIGAATETDIKDCFSVFSQYLDKRKSLVLIDRCIQDGDDNSGNRHSCAGVLSYIKDFLLLSRLAPNSPLHPLFGDLPSGGISLTYSRPENALEQKRKWGVPDYSSVYLQLLKDSLLGIALATSEFTYNWDVYGIPNATCCAFDRAQRDTAYDWPWIGVTMVGSARMEQMHELITDIVENGVEGDFVECGSWRGGAAVFARGFLDILGEQHRRVWVFDSFEGLPPNRTKSDEMFWSEMNFLRVSTEEVWENFRGHGLDNEKSVVLTKGYFVDSLPSSPVGKISILRMDGDMYESTLDTLFALYDKVSVGGYVIVDDAPRIGPSERAIRDFFKWHGFTPEVHLVPGSISGCHWKKTEHVSRLKREEYIAILTDPRHIEYQQMLIAQEQKQQQQTVPAAKTEL